MRDCRSRARVMRGDAFRVILTQPAPNVPIVNGGVVPSQDAVLLGYMLEAEGSDCKGFEVVQGFWRKKISIRSIWKVCRVLSYFTGKVPNGVTQRPIYVLPDANTPLTTPANALPPPVHVKEGYEPWVPDN